MPRGDGREVLRLLLIRVKQLLKGLKVLRRAEIQAVRTAANRVCALMQRNLKRLGKVDDVVGCAHALVPDYVFAAAEKAVLLRLGVAHVHASLHGLHGRCVVKQKRKRHARFQHLDSLASNLGGHARIHSQGKLRLQLAAAHGGVHCEQGELVGIGLIAPAYAAQDHAPVAGVGFAHHAIEGIQQIGGLLARQHAVFNIVNVPVAKVNVHSSEIAEAGERSVQPYQLHGLHQACRRIRLKIAHAGQHLRKPPVAGLLVP